MRTPGDKLKYIFMPPGWRPYYIEDSPAPVNQPAYKKYDTSVSNYVNYYVLFQYAITLAGATLFLLTAGKMHFVEKLIACSLVILSIVNYSSLFESKKYAAVFEIVRLLAASITLVVYFQLNTPVFLVAIGSWVIISAFWLLKIKHVLQ